MTKCSVWEVVFLPSLKKLEQTLLILKLTVCTWWLGQTWDYLVKVWKEQGINLLNLLKFEDNIDHKNSSSCAAGFIPLNKGM